MRQWITCSDRLKISRGVTRMLFRLLAVISLILAAFGLVVPGLPCTEFLLLACWAAARSSPRLHSWIVGHRWFGPVLENWRKGVMPRRAKWMSTLAMAFSATIMILTVPHIPSVVISIMCMSAVLVWLWCRPESSM